MSRKKINRRIRVVPEMDHLGDCAPDGRIALLSRQCPKEFLTTLVHELFHRYIPMLSEEFVEETCKPFADDLWRMRYRRTRKDT